MDLATAKDIPELTQVYIDSFRHAHKVGRIDWPDPTATSFVENLVNTGELYTFNIDEEIVGAARLSTEADRRIWGDQLDSALYLAKLATSNNVRGKHYFQQQMIPEIQEFAGESIPLRLDCLSDNEQLKSFYRRLGFIGLESITFYSDKQGVDITVTRFEKSA